MKTAILNKYVQEDAKVKIAAEALVKIGVIYDNFVVVRVDNSHGHLDIRGGPIYDIYSRETGKKQEWPAELSKKVLSEDEILRSFGTDAENECISHKIPYPNRPKAFVTIYFKYGHMNLCQILKGDTEVYNAINLDMLVDLYSDKRK
ncbi:MAG: hypothetical protein KGH59_00880 [Candidatus Micrarchaeota archaeon]|nr:hypothetical protein [Candidatus Micrarchaeota archaeon]MDE1804326.1 hypothetical protein [Candidatus Micrarchaeota archaeon]